MNKQHFDIPEEDKKLISWAAFFILLLLLGALFLSSSCTYADSTRLIATGGKGAYKGKTFALTWDHEKSFNDLAWLGMAAIPAVQAVKVAQSADKLSAIQHTNTTKQVINASDNHTKEVLGGQAADVTKTTTLPK